MRCHCTPPCAAQRLPARMRAPETQHDWQAIWDRARRSTWLWPNSLSAMPIRSTATGVNSSKPSSPARSKLGANDHAGAAQRGVGLLDTCRRRCANGRVGPWLHHQFQRNRNRTGRCACEVHLLSFARADAGATRDGASSQWQGHPRVGPRSPRTTWWSIHSATSRRASFSEASG